jgi:2-oxoisovalerate dehydrogenase E1 component alpha subunit
MIFFCRNNGYAISTPSEDQYRGDGIASRAAGYGMYCIRVDGNDLLAVRQVTEAARALAVEKSRPVLIEAMSYRRGHHSTSDDSTRYRSITEIKLWGDQLDPVKRFRNFIESKGWWDDKMEQDSRDQERLLVLQALETAEKRLKPPVEDLFSDVYYEMPQNLKEQKAELLSHIKKYPDQYDLNNQH